MITDRDKALAVAKKMDEKKLQMLLDRMEITDTITRYATSIGMHDWKGFRSCYADEVTIDYSAFTGQPPTTYKADDWVAWIRRNSSGFDAVMHYLSNHAITIQGDEATCISYVNSVWNMPNDEVASMWFAGGYYENELVRTPDGWKIQKTTMTIKWTKGKHKRFFEIAYERAAAKAQS